MDPLKDLQAAIKTCKFSKDTPLVPSAKAENILNLLDISLSRDTDSLKGRRPPLDVIIYAIKSILYPTPLYELMSEFLHLITMVEFYRLRAVEKADYVVTWQDFLQDNSTANIIHLEDAGKNFCKALTETETLAGWRKIFMEIVSRCCTIDVVGFWLNGSQTDFWIRWNECFSILDHTGEKPARQFHSFHHGLSPDDMALLHHTTSYCSGVLANSMNEGEDRRGHGQSFDEVFKSKIFQEEIGNPRIDAYLLKLIEQYLTFVQNLVQDVNDVIPDTR